MATKKSTQVIIKGRAYDMDKLEDVAVLQQMLLTASWKLPKREGVRLFLAFKELLTQELLTHLAHNWKKLLKQAEEQREDGEAPEVAIGFGVKLNFSALTVAAISDPKMSFSHKIVTKGKAKTHDINQGDFYADLSAAFNPDALAPDEEEEDDEDEDEKKDAGKGKDGKKPDAPKPASKQVGKVEQMPPQTKAPAPAAASAPKVEASKPEGSK